MEDIIKNLLQSGDLDPQLAQKGQQYLEGGR
jgi:hypothetical protein